jgi:subtilase family serine protease
VLNGHTVTFGGTSAVAPLWAGLIARINNKLGRPVGFVNPALYANPSVFHDIISGNNGAYSARPGWDACTGLGSPNGLLVEQALVGSVSGNQVVGVVNGQLWHTIRNADGSWQPQFGLVESQEQNNPGAFDAISAAGVGNQLQVVGVVNGQLWHTIRNADGSWQPQFGLVESQGPAPHQKQLLTSNATTSSRRRCSPP